MTGVIQARENLVETPPRSVGAWLLATVMLLAFLAVRPNILGESFANFGTAVCLLMLVGIPLFDWTHARLSPATVVVITTFVGGGMWATLRAGELGFDAGPYANGLVTGMVILIAFGLYLGRPDRARAFGRVLLYLIAIMSLFSAITLLMAVSVGVVQIATVSIGNLTSSVLFPFTPTLSRISFFGVPIDRALGIGREPGWWGMYAAFGWALWPAVMPKTLLSLAGRTITAVGVLTSGSTAGFGVFIVAVAFTLFFSGRRDSSPLSTYLRWTAGAIALAIAAWVAVYAPQFGLAAKSDINNVSLEGRNLATSEGLHALAQLSLGERSTIYSPNVNLIAGVSEGGWPFFVLGICALLLPLALTRHRAIAMPAMLVVFLTILLAQPLTGSHAVYLLVMLSCAIADGAPPIAQSSSANVVT
ncbi:hypothetical protein P2P98_07150 [Microbacterium sp. Kw_RZR3]|uniref:hypothetical protein n=1 Tax=Microbacterium sp. Kw_RZR3 TaxID=3032903 RepID=UPI0023DB2C6D|nr:hypothetical protein [Microbacterium sp. Kw_RZR3]MDF2045934.1 hypothetical protein [Microbacterium sp. Kw_RZR3]